MNAPAPLRPLHADSTLSSAKLQTLEAFSTEQLCNSLLPGTPHALKTRPDGTILDGHHRIYLLRQRGVNVEALPREVHDKWSLP